MISIQQLAEAFARNLRVIVMQTEGLSHADSLLQPAARGNCMNWVLGHMLDSRDRVLTMLGEEKLFTSDQKQIYTNGSEPITADGENVIALENLLVLFQTGQENISNGLAQLEIEKLDEMVGEEDRQIRFGDRLHFMYFHDTYHCGQLEYLRQLAGTNDQVI